MLAFQKLHETGDTILEVLLCIAVIGGVLTGAYVSADRSFASMRRSQERGEALKVLESQAERLKAAIKTAPTIGLLPSADAFCLNSSAQSRPVGDAACVTPETVRYNPAITRAPGTNDFTIHAQWDRFGGGVQLDQLTLYYKVYP